MPHETAPEPVRSAWPLAGALKLAIFLPSFAGGGAERASVNLARGLVEEGHEVTLVVAGASGPYREEVVPGVAVVDLRSERVVHALPGLVRYLMAERPDCLLAIMDHSNLIALAARAVAFVPTRLILGVRDTASVTLNDETTYRRDAVHLLARRLYRFADAVAAVSDGAADAARVVFALPQDKLWVVPNPVITPEIEAQALMPVDHPWLASGEPPVILGCGRLTEQKDFPTLIEAFAALRARRMARLIILGEGRDRAALEAQARALGVADDVAMPGFDLNPFRWMRRASVFVLSSIREGSPNVLIQALACGTPAVSTNCPSGPADILFGVPHGRLVAMRDSAAMAVAIEQLLDYGPQPVPASLAVYDYRNAASAYAALMQRVCAAPQRRRRTLRGLASHFVASDSLRSGR